MKNFKVNLASLLIKEVDIEAETLEDAVKIAEEKFRNVEFCLDFDDEVWANAFTTKDMIEIENVFRKNMNKYN